ncbi:glycoside hydrolase family 16 protein, partial [Pseudocercospora fijiensis CIRAD86]
TCPPVPGLTERFTDDFTTLSKVPNNWIIADYAEQYLSFSNSKGLEFRLPDGLSAPYIWTKNYLHYGKVEVTLQSAPGIGVISSAVLMSDTLDEIDWEWSGNDFALKVPTIQTNYFGQGVTGNWDRGTQPRVEKNMTQNFMTYTFDWKPDSLSWAINGNVIRTLYAKNQDNNQYRYPQSPSRFHLGLWDAGYKDVAWYTKQWAGGETDLKGFPYSLYVKKVTITPYTSCAEYQATDTTGNTASFKCLNTTDSAGSTKSAAGSSSASSLTS